MSDNVTKNQQDFAPVAERLARLPGAVVEKYADEERGIWRVELRPIADVTIGAELTGAGRLAEVSASSPVELSADELRAVAQALMAVADCLSDDQKPPLTAATPPPHPRRHLQDPPEP